jgi:uncharacterized repeat protein (TIGR01451 family)/uncharacterized delta-60 repeat protein
MTGLAAVALPALFVVVGKVAFAPATQDAPQQPSLMSALPQQSVRTMPVTQAAVTLVAPDRLPAPGLGGAMPITNLVQWAQAAPEVRAQSASQAEELVRQHRAEMLALVRQNPEAALATVLPYTVRQMLPESLRKQVETPISGRGEFKVVYVDPPAGRQPEAETQEFYVKLGDVQYRAYTYGEKLRQASARSVPLQGVTIPDEKGQPLMALSTEILRVLDPQEATALVKDVKLAASSACALCGQSDAHVVADAGGAFLHFCSPGHVTELNTALKASQRELASKKRSVAKAITPPIAGRSWTQGVKTLLYMPVLFADDPMPPQDSDGAYATADANNRFYTEASYGTVNFFTTVTPPLRLPYRKIYYGENVSQVYQDGAAVAATLGYFAWQYDFAYVMFNSVAPQATFGGRSDGLLNGSAGALTHEIGHNIGLGHANYADLSGANPGHPQLRNQPFYPIDEDSLIGHDDVNAPYFGAKPNSVEYGDPYDVMGGGSGHYNVIFKNQLNWLPDPFVKYVRQSGTNRIYAFDNPSITDGRLYALCIRKDSDKDYWASYRQGYPENPWVSNGLELMWNSGSLGTVLLDTSYVSTSGKQDASVVVGRTFSDSAANIHITPIAMGGETGPEKWMDVVVNIGPFPTNVPPTLTLVASALRVTNGTTITFTATARDVNGDPLAFNWDFGDLSFGTNGPVQTKTFDASGNFVVRCEVSDMRGGLTTTYVVVTVGTPTSFMMSGQVLDLEGNPVSGVRVHNGEGDAAYRFALTDSRGNYTMTDLASGSYKSRAFLFGNRIQPDFVGNVEIAGSDVINVNHTALPLTKVTVTQRANVSESGTTNGGFTISRVGNLETPLLVYYTLGGTAVEGDDYTVDLGTNRVGTVLFQPYETAVNIDLTGIDNAVGSGDKTISLAIKLPATNSGVQPMFIDNPGNTNDYWTNVVQTFKAPGWELLPTGLYNELWWFSTYPTYVMSGAEALTLLVDDDAPAIPSVGLYTIDTDAVETRGDSAIIMVMRSGAPITNDLTVNYTVTGMVSNGIDIVQLPGEITIPAGQDFVLLPVTAINDLSVEGNEEGNVVLTPNPARYSASGLSMSTFIVVDDDLPNVAIVATDSVASQTGGNNGRVTVSRSGDLSQPLVVTYLVTGTAESGVDFQALPQRVTIPAGSLSANIVITPIPQPENVGHKTVVIQLADNTAYNVYSQNAATVLLQDDLPSVTIAATDASAAEGAGEGTFTVTRTGDTTDGLVVYFEVGGSAVEGADYAGIGTNVLIAAGSATATIRIRATGSNDDPYREVGAVTGDDTVIIQLLAGSDYNLGSRSGASLRVSSNDGDSTYPAVGFMLRSSTVREDAGGVNLFLRCSANPPKDREVVVKYYVAGGTAIPGLNYQPITGTTGELIFSRFNAPNPPPDFLNPEGNILAIAVKILNSTNAGNRTLTLRLVNAIYREATNNADGFKNVITNAWAADYALHTITIVDVGDSLVTVDAFAPDAYESGAVPGMFRISRSGSVTSDLLVAYAVAGSAASGNDYVPLTTNGHSGFIVIPAGTNEVYVPVVPVDDPEEEIPENVRFSLLEYPGYRVNVAYADVWIGSDDGTIQFSQSKYGVLENASNAVIAVVRSGDTNRTASIDYVVAGLTAVAVEDFVVTNGTLVFNPGEAVKNITVPLINDDLVEPDETVLLTLSNPSGGVPLGGQKSAVLTILNDDVSVTFSTNLFVVNETSTNGVVTVLRAGLTNLTTTITLVITNGTATNTDFDAKTLLLTFGPGETNKTVGVRIRDDVLFEGDETITLTLTNLSTNQVLTIGAPAVLSILDDECYLEFGAPQFSVREYETYAQVTVVRLGGVVNPVRVSYFSMDATATNRLDYQAVSNMFTFNGNEFAQATNGAGNVEFRPGETVKIISVPMVDDQLGEGNETFKLLLKGLVNLGVNAMAGSLAFGTNTNTTVVIVDNETPGNVDYEYTTGLGADGRVMALALEPDGSTVFAGDFTTVDGFVYNRISRMKSIGVVDPGFNVGSGANAAVYAIASQPDGRILVGGIFNTIDRVTRSRVARLNANGSLDLSFNAGTGPNGAVRAVAMHTNGTVLVGGDFTQVAGVSRSRLARLSSTGTVDIAFNTTVNGAVQCIVVETNGSIWIGGAFTAVNGVHCGGVAKLLPDGQLDLGFSAALGANGPVYSLALQNNGRVLVAGAFTSAGGTNMNNLARFLPSGALDDSFRTGAGPSGTVYSVAVHSTGKIIIGGAFNSYDGSTRNYFARLRSNGALDTIFNPGSGANAAVLSVLVQPDSAVMIGGDFTAVNGLLRNHIARIHGDERSNIIGVEFAEGLSTVVENQGPALARVIRTGNTNIAFTIDFVVTNGTALHGLDYTASKGTLSFAAGEVFKNITVPIINDLLVEGNETVALFLTNAPPNVDMSGVTNATLVIVDDEVSIYFAYTNYVGYEASNVAEVVVVREGALFGTNRITIGMTDGTATTFLDYFPVIAEVVFLPGSTNEIVRIPIINDLIPEKAETVHLSLVNPVGAFLGRITNAVLTIVDDDSVYGDFAFTNRSPIVIQDGAPADPYPATISAVGLNGVIARVVVTLDGFTHGFPTDVDVMLVSPGGDAVLLMSDAGGLGSVAGLKLVFADEATNGLSASGRMISGVYHPTDFAPNDFFALPAPTTGYGTRLAAMNGKSGNGEWTLYIMDDRGSDAGVITNGWTLSITTVDPATVTDLSVGLLSLTNTVMAGETVTYLAAVTNLGPLPATQVVLRNPLPVGGVLKNALASQGTITNSGSEVIFQLGSLPVGAIAVVSADIRLVSAGLIDNQVHVSADEADVLPLNNQAAATVLVTPAVVADLVLDMVATPEPVLAGQNLTYVIGITNDGPLVATGVMMTNFLPSGVSLVGVSATRGSYQVSTNAEIHFNVGTLAFGEGAKMTIVVKPIIVGGLTNTVTASAVEADLSPNLATVVSTALTSADVIVRVSDVFDPAYLNGQVVYTLTVQNAGPAEAHNVTVFNNLPTQIQFVSAIDNAGGSNYYASGTIVTELGTMASGATVIIRIEGKPQVAGVFTNVVSVVAAEMDPNFANNTAAETTTISAGLTGSGIVVVGNTNAYELAAAVIGQGNEGIEIVSASLGSNTRREGSAASTGRFFITGPNGYGLTHPGVVLSSGNVEDYGSGPSLSQSQTTGFGVLETPEQATLLVPITGYYTNGTNIVPYYHYDVAQLDVRFRMMPGYNKVSFKVVFGSEEFDVFVGSSFIDGFGIYLDGVNMAYTAGGPVNINHPDMRFWAGTELNGVLAPNSNPVLDFEANVAPGNEIHTLTFIVADTTDSILDTTVFVSSLQGGIGGTADLGLNATVTPVLVKAGENLTYSMLVTNQGPDLATNVTLVATMPTNFVLVSAIPSQGFFSVTNGQVRFDLGSLFNGASATATLVVAPQAFGRFTNDLVLSSGLADFLPSDNSTQFVSAVVVPGSFVSIPALTIQDGAPASEYPSTMTVSGLGGVVSNVRVTLAGLSHKYPADIDVLLVGPQGQKVMLMSDAGQGYDLDRVDLVFSEVGATNLPYNSPISTGTYRPTDYEQGDTLPPNAPAGPYVASLAAFNGTNPNGDWKLYIVDDQGSDAGSLQGGWRLEMTTFIPGPRALVEHSGGLVTVAWPDTETGFQLEAGSSFVGPWIPVGSIIPVQTNGFYRVSFPAIGTYEFFRLVKP